jgi:hypothetical protein
MRYFLIVAVLLTMIAPNAYGQKLKWYDAAGNPLANSDPAFPTDPGPTDDIVVPAGFGVEVLANVEFKSLTLQPSSGPVTWVDGNGFVAFGQVSVEGEAGFDFIDFRSAATPESKLVVSRSDNTSTYLGIDGQLAFDQVVVDGQLTAGTKNKQIGQATLSPSVAPNIPNKPLLITTEQSTLVATLGEQDSAVVASRIDVSGIAELNSFFQINAARDILNAIDGPLTVLTAESFAPGSRISGQRQLENGSYLVPFMDDRSIVLKTVALGDADGSGAIDIGDFGILKESFGKAWSAMSGSAWQNGDLDGNRVIDLNDFGMLKDSFGGVAPVPEPSALLLACLGGLALLAKRRIRGGF